MHITVGGKNMLNEETSKFPTMITQQIPDGFG